MREVRGDGALPESHADPRATSSRCGNAAAVGDGRLCARGREPAEEETRGAIYGFCVMRAEYCVAGVGDQHLGSVRRTGER